MPLNRPGSGGDGRLPVIWVVTVSRLSRLVHDVTPEFDARARIETIHLGFEDAARELRRRLQTEHCDVLVAAGSNGAYLKGRINKPLVLIRPSGFDLMQALSSARRVSPSIGVITHQTELPAFAEFQNSFKLKIEQRAFVTEEDARNRIAELVTQDVKVIVGTGMVADLAEEAGVKGVLMYSADSIRLAFENAIDLAGHIDNADQTDRLGSGFAARATQRRAPTAHRYSVTDLIGHSAQMRQLRERIGLYGASDATVLISGATGTGKELAAQSLHGLSARSKGPFVAINCGAIAESLLESELFGHDEGAFTGARRGGRIGLIEAAKGGTLFLDEIGEMPLPLQTRLLRVLEEREVTRVGSSTPIPVDVRVIAATHTDLDSMTRESRFRRDLYYRLNVLRLEIPALYEHAEDIAELAQFFLRRASGDKTAVLDADALTLLRAYAWPGNVRELRNVIERLPILSKSVRNIGAELLKSSAPELTRSVLVAAPPNTSMEIPVATPTRQQLAEVMARAGGHRGRAAALLGVSRTTLWRWLQAQGVT
ncbi:propionate catabolism operon regulatory protein PrpR [Stenotrophobium rhamnosiphilum]|uniref:Propionate catabolism operon regulatory protein PrpR n=1 Tax=Stenotrophobium rhamnosiphilum TaxID=2029166 RepID=A0A2T5MGI7_9GAMM|nr:propionate catabolism operon regulatory protein PrpR [Stenotrophobium rhamnosiphilum]PTU31698.1 propionate catabolism operon regulatory protein PrpR [Stenotrophobium rhamnosiphilum]